MLLPLPNKMNLPDLDDFEELDEDLEEITEDNLNDNIEEVEEESKMEETPPSYEDLRKPPKSNMFDDFKEMAQEKFKSKAKKKPKPTIKNSGSKGASNNKILKYIKTIGITLIAIIVVLFIVGKIFGNSNSSPKATTDKTEKTSSGKDIEITDRGFIEGKPYVTITSKSDNIQIEFVETAFKNGDNIIKCTAFNPYLEEGDSIVEYEDCDGVYNDKEPMKEFIDNLKVKGE